jgi:hypothetical protein
MKDTKNKQIKFTNKNQLILPVSPLVIAISILDYFQES